MAKSKVDILKEKIVETRALERELTGQLKKVCKHKKVICRNTCTDDWAVPKRYQDSYKCLDCGLSTYSPEYSSDDKGIQEVSKEFEILYKRYWKYMCFSESRINKFDKQYKVVSKK